MACPLRLQCFVSFFFFIFKDKALIIQDMLLLSSALLVPQAIERRRRWNIMPRMWIGWESYTVEEQNGSVFTERAEKNKGIQGLRWWTQILSLGNYQLQLPFHTRLTRTLILHIQSPGSFPLAWISLDTHTDTHRQNCAPGVLSVYAVEEICSLPFCLLPLCLLHRLTGGTLRKNHSLLFTAI